MDRTQKRVNQLTEYSVEVNNEGAVITIKLPSAATHELIVKEKVEDILQLLLLSISAQLAWLELSERERSDRIIVYLATDLKLQALLKATEAQLHQHFRCVHGHLTPKDIGFPEFDKDIVHSECDNE